MVIKEVYVHEEKKSLFEKINEPLEMDILTEAEWIDRYVSDGEKKIQRNTVDIMGEDTNGGGEEK